MNIEKSQEEVKANLRQKETELVSNLAITNAEIYRIEVEDARFQEAAQHIPQLVSESSNRPEPDDHYDSGLITTELRNRILNDEHNTDLGVQFEVLQSSWRMDLVNRQDSSTNKIDTGREEGQGRRIPMQRAHNPQQLETPESEFTSTIKINPEIPAVRQGLIPETTAPIPLQLESPEPNYSEANLPRVPSTSLGMHFALVLVQTKLRSLRGTRKGIERELWEVREKLRILEEEGQGVPGNSAVQSFGEGGEV